ncbi:MAG: NAD(P)/FAD-dependent oxidoreductase [Actinomycetota bacterium]
MRVGIVGAGAAGLTAAKLLHDAGHDIEVFEASDSHGGRVRKTELFEDVPIDIGAEWVHHWVRARPASIASIFSGRTPGHETFRYKPQRIANWHRGRLRDRSWLRFIPGQDDRKFVDSSWYDVIDDLASESTRSRIRYETPIVRIEHGADSVTLWTQADASHTADVALVTVPIAMLQQRRIEFVPPLPDDKQREIDKEHMPAGLKVFIEFSERFYPDLLNLGSMLGSILGSSGDSTYYDATLGKPTDRHILGLFTQGARADRYVANGDDDAIAQYVLDELDEIFDGKASCHHLRHVVQNWSAEHWIGGSYSHRAASAKTLAAPVGTRLLFAGEAMHPGGKTIAVQGAVESAELAVAQLLDP